MKPEDVPDEITQTSRKAYMMAKGPTALDDWATAIAAIWPMIVAEERERAARVAEQGYAISDGWLAGAIADAIRKGGTASPQPPSVVREVNDLRAKNAQLISHGHARDRRIQAQRAQLRQLRKVVDGVTNSLGSPMSRRMITNLSAQNRDLCKQIEDMKAAHDRRVAELLAANNAEVERRRAAETATHAPALVGCVCPAGAETTCKSGMCPRLGSFWWNPTVGALPSNAGKV